MSEKRSFTPAQKAAVDRVRKCRTYDYYAILDIESTCTDGEVKRAYRKLALIMHPDKNSAPGADEAFKLVSKAFQILSDPKRSEFSIRPARIQILEAVEAGDSARDSAEQPREVEEAEADITDRK